MRSAAALPARSARHAKKFTTVPQSVRLVEDRDRHCYQFYRSRILTIVLFSEESLARTQPSLCISEKAAVFVNIFSNLLPINNSIEGQKFVVKFSVQKYTSVYKSTIYM